MDIHIFYCKFYKKKVWILRSYRDAYFKGFVNLFNDFWIKKKDAAIFAVSGYGYCTISDIFFIQIYQFLFFFGQFTITSIIYELKERVHSEMKSFERLDYCPHIQPLTLIFLKSVPTFHDCVSVSKLFTSRDLHHTFPGPASQYPRTCITPSVDLHQSIWGPESEHPDLHRTIQGPASHHRNLHQAIRTCIILP